ncbi:LLM class flavin-dependent oxidoreductase [Corynebacterium auriscanis]|uniref:LLM class flavin-dependent oxidoreductase n=1 Tax=Corynebacterium auriscanis TaxID=99807 RepID=UPI003CFADBAA
MTSTHEIPHVPHTLASQKGDITLHWFLPTQGDARNIVGGGHGSGRPGGQREASLEYLTQIARAAEYNGFESVLTPTGQWCYDSWLTTASLISATSRLKFLIAFRPGLVSPTLIAQQAQTFQHFSNNRLNLNVVIGGEDAEQRAFGDHLTKQQRYTRADEALEIYKGLVTGAAPVNFNGEYNSIENAELAETPEIAPQVFFGGSSPEGIAVAAKHADVYLTWGEPVDRVKNKLDRVRTAARTHGRKLEFGIRLHVLARPTEEEAWAEAQLLLDHIDPEEVRRVQTALAKSQSEGQRRMSDLHGRGSVFHAGADARSLEITPNLWAGVGLVRGGAGTSLVGSYDQVADRIAEYQSIGLTHFILSGYPHLEEAFYVGEGVVPALLKRELTVTNHAETSPSATTPATL